MRVDNGAAGAHISRGEGTTAMVEIMIECWSQRDGSVDWLWSIWSDGRRRHMGGSHDSAESAELEARDACRKLLGRAPDEVRVL